LYSEEYVEGELENVQRQTVAVFGLGVPVYLAFREWWPVMQREKKRALAAGRK